MIIKKYCSVLLAMFISANVFAAKVAVFDVPKVFEESKRAQAQRRELQAEFSPRRKILQGKEAELQLKVLNYEKNHLTLSDKELKNLEKEILQLRRDYQQYSQQFQAELQEAQKKNIRAMELEIEDIVTKIAEKEGFDLVLYQGVAYHKKTLDITNKILIEMDKNANKKLLGK